MNAMTSLFKSRLGGACLRAAEFFQRLSGRFLAAAQTLLSKKL